MPRRRRGLMSPDRGPRKRVQPNRQVLPASQPGLARYSDVRNTSDSFLFGQDKKHRQEGVQAGGLLVDMAAFYLDDVTVCGSNKATKAFLEGFQEGVDDRGLPAGASTSRPMPRNKLASKLVRLQHLATPSFWFASASSGFRSPTTPAQCLHLCAKLQTFLDRHLGPRAKCQQEIGTGDGYLEAASQATNEGGASA